MLEDDLIEYYNNWKAKVEAIKGDTTAEVFDRFISLYPVHNKLYNRASEILKAKGVISSKGGDKKAATINLVTYLGPEVILNEFQNNNNIKDVEHIIQIMENNLFNIVLDEEGNSNPAKDKDLLVSLKSENKRAWALSITVVIYHVRCNYVHGEKDFHDVQILLLEPINKLLATLNHLLYTKLSE